MTVPGIILAAAAGFATGAAGYMWHGDRWIAAAGRTRAEIEADRSPVPFAIGGIASLLTAIMLSHILTGSGITGAFAALVAGSGTGVLLAAPWIVLNHAFAGRPRSLRWIDGGHVVAAHGVIALVLGLFL